MIIRVINQLISISHEAIYWHIYTRLQASFKQEVNQTTYSKENKRAKGSKIYNQVSIDKRPKYIELKSEVRH